MITILLFAQKRRFFLWCGCASRNILLSPVSKHSKNCLKSAWILQGRLSYSSLIHGRLFTYPENSRGRIPKGFCMNTHEKSFFSPHTGQDSHNVFELLNAA